MTEKEYELKSKKETGIGGRRNTNRKSSKSGTVPRTSRLVGNQLSRLWRNQCIGGCIRVWPKVTRQFRLVRTCVRYIDIYLLGRFTPQSTVGCLVFTSRAMTLLVFLQEDTHIPARPFLSLSFCLRVLCRLSLSFVSPTVVLAAIHRRTRYFREPGGVVADHLSIVCFELSVIAPPIFGWLKIAMARLDELKRFVIDVGIQSILIAIKCALVRKY